MDDLSVEIKNGSRLAVAAACFSIYAFEELKKNYKVLMNFALFSLPQPLLPKKHQKPKGSFIFRGLIVSVASTAKQ